VGSALRDQAHCRANLAGRAVAALKSIMIDKGSLHWMQSAVVRQSFDRGDLSAVFHDGQRETGIYPTTIDQNGARATLPVIATLFGAGKTEMNTQGIEQRSPGGKG